VEDSDDSFDEEQEEIVRNFILDSNVYWMRVFRMYLG